MQVDPMKPMLKPPGTKHLKLKCGMLLSTFAFKFNLRRYNEYIGNKSHVHMNSTKVGRCKLTLSNYSESARN